VGVFLDEDIDTLVETVLTSGVTFVQLHGKEDDAYIRAVKERTGKKVIKTFKPSSAEDVRLAEKSEADMIMFDPGVGSGKTFNWDILSGCTRDFFLAGGLDPDNAALAVQTLKPYALDVSSGVETEGIKDGKKIEEFINNTRNA
jgi:phosphoribosylanthranilate isomerase